MIFEDTVSEYNFFEGWCDYIVININNKDWDELTVMKYQPMPIQFTNCSDTIWRIIGTAGFVNL